jgi:hypothetical protein
MEIKMTTQEELEVEKQRTEGSRVAFDFLKWLLAHGIVFRQCQENSDAISSYLREKHLDFTFPSAVAAYNALTERGHRFLLDKLAPPAAAEEELPDLPEVPGMNPQIFTVSDINNMDRERYKKLYFGPHSAQFRARVTEIMRRAKEEK